MTTSITARALQPFTIFSTVAGLQPFANSHTSSPLLTCLKSGVACLIEMLPLTICLIHPICDHGRASVPSTELRWSENLTNSQAKTRSSKPLHCVVPAPGSTPFPTDLPFLSILRHTLVFSILRWIPLLTADYTRRWRIFLKYSCRSVLRRDVRWPQ